MEKMFVRRLGAAVMTFVALATFGCGGALSADAQGESSAGVQQAPLDGRALYTGIIFGVGRGAQLVPEIWENVAPDIRSQLHGREAEIEMAANAVADKILELDAAFFARFAEGIRSGDHVRIAQALKDARQQTHLAVAAMRGVPVDQVALLDKENEAVKEQCVVVVVAVAVAVVAVAVLFLAEEQRLGLGLDGRRLSTDSLADILARKDFSAAAQ